MTALRSSCGIRSVGFFCLQISPFTSAHYFKRFMHLLGLGIMPALLQEIVSVYPLLSPPNLTAHVSNRVCNALALLQCVASHPDTRQLFLNGTHHPAWSRNVY